MTNNEPHTEADYRDALLKAVTEKQIKAWLENNPKPAAWEGGLYSWAYCEMPIFTLPAFFRHKTR